MMGEFDSSSTIKYMIGPSMIKYQVLDDLFKNIRINEHVVVFHVDAWSILYRMYRTRYLETIHSVPTEVLVKDLVVSFINVLGHYRKYFYKHLHKTNDILVYLNTKLPGYQESVFSDYMKTQYDLLSIRHKDYGAVSYIVQKAFHFIKGLLPYFEGIYYIENDNIDTFTAMNYFMQLSHYQDQYHIIFSRNLLPTQLLNDHTIQLVNKREDSYILYSDDCIKNGFLRDRKTVVHKDFTSKMVPFILSMSGYSGINMKPIKSVRGVSDVIKLLTPLMKDHIIASDMSIQSFLKEVSSNMRDGGAQLRIGNSMINRYRAVALDLATKALSNDQKFKLTKHIVDLYDQSMLEMMNEKLSEIGNNPDLLEITSLNMSTVPEYDGQDDYPELYL